MLQWFCGRQSVLFIGAQQGDNGVALGHNRGAQAVIKRADRAFVAQYCTLLDQGDAALTDTEENGRGRHRTPSSSNSPGSGNAVVASGSGSPGM